MILDKDSEGSKISGKLISMSLGELGLEAHPQKTVQVVVGSESYIENMTKELEANPTTILQHGSSGPFLLQYRKPCYKMY